MLITARVDAVVSSFWCARDRGAAARHHLPRHPRRARSPRTNTSSQLVERADVGLLVDAGLGATRQLLLAGVRPADLEGLLLTHWHPDHVGGLVPLLRRRWTARAPRLPVFGPSPPRVLAPLVRRGIDLTPARPGQPVELAGFTCTPFSTLHGTPSCGWLLEDADGRRVVIAGDTRPIPEVVDAVRGVDVLVYEATFAAHHAERALKSGTRRRPRRGCSRRGPRSGRSS